VLRAKGEAGLIASRDSKGVPIFERYFVGGIYDVRASRRGPWARRSRP